MRRFVLISLALAAPAAAQQPTDKAEVAQLYRAAGFPIVDDRPTNRCGAPAQPGTRFVDLNGDKRAEVLFLDASPVCYEGLGTYFAVLGKHDTGWKPVITGLGTIRARLSRTNGWLDMTVLGDGVSRTYVFDGARYVLATGIAPAAPGAAVPPAGAWQLPKKAASLTPAERDTLFRAAGFVRRGGQWKGCDGMSDAALADDDTVGGNAIRDLNGDGKPEVILSDSGTGCYGMTGTGFHILTPAGSGWKVFWSSAGMPTFLAEKGAGGWPDIEVGGPGFCQSVYGWDGRSYDIRYFREYDRGACRRQQVPANIPVRPAR